MSEIPDYKLPTDHDPWAEQERTGGDKLSVFKGEDIEAHIDRDLKHLSLEVRQRLAKKLNPVRVKGLKRRDSTEQNSTHSPPANGFKLFDIVDVGQRLKLVKQDREHEDERTMLSNMIRQGGQFSLRALPDNFSAIMDEMGDLYPHFSNVTNFLRQRMVFAQVQGRPVLSFGVSVLLNGPAGVGKSSYLMTLSEKLGTIFINLSCAGASNGFDIVGLSSGWGTGRPGKLHDILVNQDCPNPIILLDEVEKASKDDKSNLPGTLYGLLEKNNARSFKDEFIDVPMDASKINWFATSNDASLLDSAIQDRFTVLSVEAPNSADLAKIIPHLYKELLVEHQLQDVLANRFPVCITKKMAETERVSIRVVKNVLEQALVNAIQRRAGRKYQCKITLVLADLPDAAPQKHERKPIGFIW